METQNRMLEVTTMYDNLDKFLRNKDARLRVRIIGDICEFSYKQPLPAETTKSTIKHEIEHEVIVSSAAILESILEELNFQ